MTQLRKLTQILLNILIPLVTIGLILWLLPKSLSYFMPFVIGGIIAWIANPLVRFLEHKVKIRRKYSTFLTIGGALALVIGGGYLLISRLARMLMRFLGDLPGLLQSISAQLQLAFARLDSMAQKLPAGVQLPNVSEPLENIGASLMEGITSFVSKLGAPTVEAAGNLAKRLPGIFVAVFFTILSAYFFLAEKEQLLRFYRKYTPKQVQKYLGFIRSHTGRLVGGYFLAQFRIMGVVALMLLVGFLILGVPYAPVWAILISLLDVLPVFGTGTILIPWALIQLLSGKIYMAIGLAACWILTQVVRQMIQPKVVGDSMGLNPLLTLFLLYLGFQFSGLGGMILAVPVGMIVIELYRYGAFASLIQAVRDLIDFINAFRRGEDMPQRTAEGKAAEPAREDEDQKASESVSVK